MKFKVNDIVTGNNDKEGSVSVDEAWELAFGEIFEVVEVEGEEVFVEVLVCAEREFIGNTYKFNADQLKLYKKFSKEDLTKYMVYGTGCANKSWLYSSKKQMEKMARVLTYDDEWSGEIIGYKLTPIFTMERKTVLNNFR